MSITRRAFSGGALASGALAASQAAAKKRDPVYDVIVLGAGVSGLQAAWMLEQQGARVLVLEGRKRVGGRIYTLLDQPGTPEMGFNSMGALYGRAIEAAHRAGVKLYNVAPRMAKAFQMALVLGGQFISRKDWPTHPANPFPPALKQLMPWEITPVLLSQHNPLTNWAEWLDPKNAKLDISMHDYLAQNGLSAAAIALAFDTAPYYGSNASDVSALLFEFNAGWGKTQAAGGPESWAVEGGNQNLPIGMAKLLKGGVALGHKVTAISQNTSNVRLHCENGASFTAKHIVCALPFATLRRIAISPGLPNLQARAVKNLPYQPISIAFLTTKSPFWLKDGHAPSLWTDGPVGNVVAQFFGPTENDVTGLCVFARGGLALRWDKLGKDAALRMMIAELEKIRPAARGQLQGITIQSWASDPFNLGDWAYFAPGQISSFVRGMSVPAGRIHFCGEHTATANRGVEGAFESAERAAVEILSL